MKPPISVFVGAFGGLGVTVSRKYPNQGPISTDGFWITAPEESQPYGQDYRRSERRRCLVLPRLEGSQLQKGDLIDAPADDGQPVESWEVQRIERDLDPDAVRVIVKPVQT